MIEYYYFGEVDFVPNKKQEKSIELVFENVSKIVDLNKIQDWTVKENVSEVFIFGSRVNLTNCDESDLDIMVDSSNVVGMNDDNYIEVQREALNDYYKSFQSSVIDTSIELDFKLNTTDGEFYSGITYGEDYSDEGECDFYFDYEDIPFMILINKEGIYFAFSDNPEEGFKGNMSMIV